MVVSVGPYIFQSSFTIGISFLGNTLGIASPPQNALIFNGSERPLSSILTHITGVPCKMVIPSAFTNSINRRLSFTTSASASTRVAPLTKGKNVSSVAISKDMVVVARMISLLSAPGLCRMLVKRFKRLACVTCTPFGCPVDPEV